MIYLGDYAFGSTIYLKWSSSDQGGASITRGDGGSSGSPDNGGEIRIYKNDSLAQYGSPGGIDDITDFDDLTGVHHVTIDTSVDEFYEAGAEYQIVLAGALIDDQLVNAVLAHFSIENRDSV